MAALICRLAQGLKTLHRDESLIASRQLETNKDQNMHITFSQFGKYFLLFCPHRKTLKKQVFLQYRAEAEHRNCLGKD